MLVYMYIVMPIFLYYEQLLINRHKVRYKAGVIQGWYGRTKIKFI